MLDNQLIKRWILHQAIIEVPSQCQDDDEWTVSLRTSSHQQIKKLLTLLLVLCQGEDFFELIHHQNHMLRSPSSGNRRCIEMQTRERSVVHIPFNHLQAFLWEMLEESMRKPLKRMLPRNDRIEIDPRVALKDPACL